VTHAEQQRAIVEKAIRDRIKDRFPLQWMTFALTELDDAGLEIFLEYGIEVENLYLMRTQVTDRGIELVNRFPRLRELDISETATSPTGFGAIEP